MFYSPGSEQYREQKKGGFYSSSNARLCYIPFWNGGDRIVKGSLTLYDKNTHITISDDASGNLYDPRFDSKTIIGNVFYESCVAILWEDEQAEYINFATGSNWAISLTSETDILRKQWSFTIGLNEFNYSQNPSSVNFYPSRLQGLGALNFGGRAAYIYTGSDLNRSKKYDRVGTHSLSTFGTPRALEYFTNKGLHFPSASYASSSAYGVSSSIFSYGTQSHRSYLIVVNWNPYWVTQSADTNGNFFEFYNYASTVGGGVQSFAASISESAAGYPVCVLTTKQQGGLIGHVTWSSDTLYSKMKDVKQIAYYVDINQVAGWCTRSIFVNGTSSYNSSAHEKNPKDFFMTNSNCSYFYTMNKVATGSASPDKGLIFSGSIANLKMYEFVGEAIPDYERMKKYIHEEYLSGSHNLSEEGGQYKISTETTPPYMTTIGMFNDRNQLIAIGKFARPIPNDPDVPINILAQLDIL